MKISNEELVLVVVWVISVVLAPHHLLLQGGEGSMERGIVNVWKCAHAVAIERQH